MSIRTEDVHNECVSVVMPVYKAEAYIVEAVSSLLSQSYSNFKLIAVYDYSEDKTLELLESFSDSRLKIILNKTKNGIASALNVGLKHAKGEFIARMDADDVALPRRFEHQVNFLKSHPDVAIVGCAAHIMGEGGQVSRRLLRHPSDSRMLEWLSIFDCFFVHPSVMMRKTVLDDLGGYSEDISRNKTEDYELWSRLLKRFKGANLSKPLLKYRETSNSLSRGDYAAVKECVAQLCSENISYYLGADYSIKDIKFLASFMHLGVELDSKALKKARRIYFSLLEMFSRKAGLQKRLLHNSATKYWPQLDRFYTLRSYKLFWVQKVKSILRRLCR